MFLKVKPNTNKINVTNMIPFEESDYGFFCDIEKEFNIYPKQTIRTTRLSTIVEHRDMSISASKLDYDNLKYDLHKINIKSLIAFLFVSLSSIYLTTKIFYKYYP